MKVLLVNRYLYPAGGDTTYTLSLARLLRERGNESICFGLQDARNDPSLAAPVLLEAIDFPALMKSGGVQGAVSVLGRTIYSPAARARMDEVLQRERPDLVHLQNIHHHLSPSVIAAANARGIPVVWTLHDFSVICPNGNLYSNGRVCEECRPVSFHRAVINRCKRQSLGASFVAALESTAHRVFGMFDGVELFISPSRFLQSKLLEFGFYPDRVVHLDNFVAGATEPPRPRAPRRERSEEGYLLYAGRLVPEKGILTLLHAARLWGATRLRIAGEGPLRPIVLEACRENPRIEYVGQVGEERMWQLLNGALAAVLPSEWYENQPYAAIEAFCAGRPVIGSALGAIPELLGEEERGVLFTPGDAGDLARAARRLLADPARMEAMGAAAFRFARDRFSVSNHYDGLMALYERALRKEAGRAA